MALHGDITLSKINAGARDLKPFKAGNVSGRYYFHEVGILPEEWRYRFQTSDRDGEIYYVFYSYKTPIAWLLTSGEWVQPDVKYSASTSNHQSVVGYAISRHQRWACCFPETPGPACQHRANRNAYAVVGVES